MSSLHPVSGSAAEIFALLAEWDRASDPEPLVVETSGSTGVPKRVVLSRAAMRASADATHRRLGGPGQWLLTLPPTYVAGIQVLFRSVRAGTEPVVERSLWHGAESMTHERRYVSVVPTQLHRALDEGYEAQALSRFDAVLVGGASLDQGLRAEAEEVGARLVATYGMAETCGGCVYDGRPLDGVELSTSEDGRLRIRGPVLFDGYEGRQDWTAQVRQGGWFLTADLGRLEDGRLLVLGRVDDVVVSGGVNVPTGAVAERLRLHPRVREAEVLGVADDEWGRAVVAVVVGEVTLAEARDWVAEALLRSWAPRSVVRVDALPLLPNGKVDRLAVETLAGEGLDRG